jgi:hypothetical protein
MEAAVDQPVLGAAPKGLGGGRFIRLSTRSRLTAVILARPPHSPQSFLRPGKLLSTYPVALQSGQSAVSEALGFRAMAKHYAGFGAKICSSSWITAAAGPSSASATAPAGSALSVRCHDNSSQIRCRPGSRLAILDQLLRGGRRTHLQHDNRHAVLLIEKRRNEIARLRAPPMWIRHCVDYVIRGGAEGTKPWSWSFSQSAV